MFRLIAGFRKLQNNGVFVRRGLIFSGVSSLLAVVSIIALAPAFAKDSDEKNAKSSGKQAAIPECLEKLKLSAQQEEQIKGIVGSYDESLHKVWKQFGDRYLQTITMESTMLAAIEDNLTDAQRQKVREQRHKTAQYEKGAAATNDKPNQAPAKSASGAEDEIADAGVLLTAEQEAAADKIQDKYRSQLRSLNRDIQGLHIRLVSLEADKLVAIEKVLTKDQLAQLRLNRQTAPVSKKLEITSTEPKKTE